VEPSEVLDRWFGTLDADGLASPAHQRSWYVKDPAFDADLRRQFGDVHRQVAAGDHPWFGSVEGRLAAIVVLDQLSRNMYRDTPGMYAQDALALHLARVALAAGDAPRWGVQPRTFLYMPFMHSEALADQERCVAEFLRLADETSGRAGGFVRMAADYAERHRVIVARFGRFPHRNTILGRASTDAEVAFLREPGSSF
jgi:uncharacterized protein (DUF924 family)